MGKREPGTNWKSHKATREDRRAAFGALSGSRGKPKLKVKDLSGGDFAGEADWSQSTTVTFYIGLKLDRLAEVVGAPAEDVKTNAKCRIGAGLRPEEVRSGRIEPDTVIGVLRRLRKMQPRTGWYGSKETPLRQREKVVGDEGVAGSLIKMRGIYKGAREESVAVTIFHDPFLESKTAFDRNMRRLAQDMACALGQESIITSFGHSDQTYSHTPTPFEDEAAVARFVADQTRKGGK